MNTTQRKDSETGRGFGGSLARRHIILTACILIALGYLLMSGAGSTQQSFNPDIFSTRRIVVAPALCLSGYLLMIIGILRNPPRKE